MGVDIPGCLATHGRLFYGHGTATASEAGKRTTMKPSPRFHIGHCAARPA